ncbi:MAG: hypothetical protein R2991_03430 [Thermoanaerobaculia bacterium]
MDLCREIAVPAPSVVSVPPNTDYDVPLLVNSVPSATVRDLDVGLGLAVDVRGGEPRGSERHDRGAGVAGATALLGQNIFSTNTIYDDDTNPALDPLSTFDQHQAAGTWLLRLSHDSTQTVEVTINRFEIRLHVDPSSPCV